ncbi:hypothetical protein D3C71_1344750 [compost metagenome]
MALGRSREASAKPSVAVWATEHPKPISRARSARMAEKRSSSSMTRMLRACGPGGSIAAGAAAAVVAAGRAGTACASPRNAEGAACAAANGMPNGTATLREPGTDGSPSSRRGTSNVNTLP